MGALERALGLLPHGGGARVGVVADASVDLDPVRSRGNLVRLDPARRADLHVALSARPHLDLLVDLGRGDVARRLPMLLTHVRRGGHLVVPVPRRPALRAALHGLVDTVTRLRDAGPRPPDPRRDARPERERDEHALAASVAAIDVDDDVVVVRMGVAVWSVVPEGSFDDVLAADAGLGQVVVRRPAEAALTAGTVVSSHPDVEAALSTRARALSLREVTDVLVAPRMVATARQTVLPQAFRNTEHRRPRSPALAEWTGWAVRVPDGLPDDPDCTSGTGGTGVPRLDGTYLHLDNLFRGHFGHAITEQLSHLWAWPQVLERHPDARVLVTDADRPVAPWELELLAAAGVPADRVVTASGPVRVERLLQATPGYVVLRHVHPSLRAHYERIGDVLEAEASSTARPERLFLTRRGNRRDCRNADEVEALFTDHGFTVVAPEEHPLSDQVAMVRAARAVGGFAGSGLFHLLLGGSPRPVLAVSHTRYHVWNERAICALWGHPLTIIRGTPDRTTRAWSAAAMHSAFHVDLAAEGRLLRETLATLDA
ncbi:hypothetical protein GCM10023340_18740 [Nocardioides marinquilinus]|uniref:Glycosyltransferase 61 catalytic domain-containing protein n=1 Tax=Nocardioides marinquilinus TaxID=1210400 RepID=A0ABP9PIE3_9ACTN